MPKLTYPLAYCLQLDCIITPDHARNAHASFLNEEPNKNFDFFCPNETCGCKFKGSRIHRWEQKNGTAYFSRYNNNPDESYHSETCEYFHLNPGNNIGGGGNGIVHGHEREVLYPSWLSLEDNYPEYEFNLNTHILSREELLFRITQANINMVNWNEVPVNDLRIIVEAYHSMNENEKNNNFLRINEDEPLRYKNSFRAMRWLPRADGLYKHIYYGKIKNKQIKKEDNFYTFALDWNMEDYAYNGRSFKIYIEENLVQYNYLAELFEANLNGTKWNNAYFYIIDPNYEFDKNGRGSIKILPTNNSHFVIRVTD